MSTAIQTQVIERETTAVPGTEPARDAGSMVAMIERIVMDPNITIDRLQQVLALKERMEDRAREDDDRRAKRAYFAAMSRCQTELPIVTKTQENKHTNSKYADLAAIEEQAMPIIHGHGFGVTFQPAGYNEKGELQIKWKITHDEGHSESDIAGIPVDSAGSQGKVNKTGTQAFGSTATYGRRYLLCMLFNISTGDDRDGNADNSGGEAITEAQVATLRKTIGEIYVDQAKCERADARLCAHLKVRRLEDLPASKYGDAVVTLENARPS